MVHYLCSLDRFFLYFPLVRKLLPLLGSAFAIPLFCYTFFTHTSHFLTGCTLHPYLVIAFLKETKCLSLPNTLARSFVFGHKKKIKQTPYLISHPSLVWNSRESCPHPRRPPSLNFAMLCVCFASCCDFLLSLCWVALPLFCVFLPPEPS